MAISSKSDARRSRKVRIRKKISGTALRPRLVVYRSNMHLYAQLVDDDTHVTLASVSTLTLAKNNVQAKANKAGADLVGKEIARLAKEKNIQSVVFDRNGYIYHGRVKSLADGAREAGLEF